MFTIELYLKYLHNSLLGKSKSNQADQLKLEKSKIADIVNNVDNCFYGDQSLTANKDKSIYTYIKKNIIAKMLADTNRINNVILESKFYLDIVLNEIDYLYSNLSA